MRDFAPAKVEKGPSELAGLRLVDVCVAVRGQELLRISALISPGEVMTVMGPSGAGKSSLLAFLAGTLPPAFAAGGNVYLDGESLDGLPPEMRRLGILFQDDLLFPHLSVGGNLAFALPPSVRGRKARRAAVEKALATADLAGFADRDPATLSGGQRARVAVMRVLLSQPKALLLDEPFSKLDASLRESFRAFVFGEVRHHRLPAIMVTHDPADAAAAGGPVIILE
ncbi:MAG: ATP-binding cassette domain-containing protein [Hyphomicrobiaceae bacterium]|nr:MAG: ATP-binding cassette domain-containing protein [Hyphomicrobiaceae bacterium]